MDIFEGLTSDAGANWYDFGVGMGSIALLVLLKGNVCCYSNLEFNEFILHSLERAQTPQCKLAMGAKGISFQGYLVLGHG